MDYLVGAHALEAGRLDGRLDKGLVGSVEGELAPRREVNLLAQTHHHQAGLLLSGHGQSPLGRGVRSRRWEVRDAGALGGRLKARGLSRSRHAKTRQACAALLDGAQDYTLEVEGFGDADENRVVL